MMHIIYIYYMHIYIICINRPQNVIIISNVWLGVYWHEFKPNISFYQKCIYFDWRPLVLIGICILIEDHRFLQQITINFMFWLKKTTDWLSMLRIRLDKTIFIFYQGLPIQIEISWTYIHINRILCYEHILFYEHIFTFTEFCFKTTDHWDHSIQLWHG